MSVFTNLPMIKPSKRALNRGRIIGQKRPFLPKHVWAIRVRLELSKALLMKKRFQRNLSEQRRIYKAGGVVWLKEINL